jgi:hypothetical protein
MYYIFTRLSLNKARNDIPTSDQPSVFIFQWHIVLVLNSITRIGMNIILKYYDVKKMAGSSSDNWIY